MDTLVMFGGSVKALGKGRVGGHLVLFTTAEDPDLSQDRDFFDSETDFDLERSTKATLLYSHGLDPTLKGRKLGLGEMKTDDVGVWIEGQLELRDDYEKAVYKLADAGKLGWSSGTATHLVERQAEGKANHVLRWPLGLDASLTPTPAEPRTLAMPIKSLHGLPSLRALSNPGLKGEMLGDDLDANMTLAALRALYEALMNRIYGALYGWMYDDQGNTIPLETRLTTLRACFDEYRDEAIQVLDALMTEAGSDESGLKRLKRALLGHDGLLTGGVRLDSIKTERDFERYLREAGFAKSAANVITTKGFKALHRRDSEDTGEANTSAHVPALDLQHLHETYEAEWRRMLVREARQLGVAI